MPSNEFFKNPPLKKSYHYLLQLSPVQADLVCKGLRAIRWRLKYNDTGSVTNGAKQAEIDDMLRQLEGFVHEHLS